MALNDKFGEDDEDKEDGFAINSMKLAENFLDTND